MDARGYRLGVDFGTSNTVAMLAWPDGQVRPLLFDGSPTLPSAVYADADSGLLIGRDAAHAARVSPERYEPNPKRRIDESSVLLGDVEVATVDLIAAVIRRVAVEAHRVAGQPVGPATVTFPAAWAQTRRGILVAAAERAGLGPVTVVPEPVAAASVFVGPGGAMAPPGSVFVVYDLGAGTFDASVVRRSGSGFEVLSAEGLSQSGGLDIDAAIVGYLGAVYSARDPELWGRLLRPTSTAERRANRLLWEDVRAAKEMLSRAASTMIHVPLADEDAPLGRDQLEQLARPILEGTVTATRAAVAAAGVPQGGLSGIFLVGGGSRIPLVATLLHQAFGIAPTAVEQPELVVAQGSLGAGDAVGPVSSAGAGAVGPGSVSGGPGSVSGGPGSVSGGPGSVSGGPGMASGPAGSVSAPPGSVSGPSGAGFAPAAGYSPPGAGYTPPGTGYPPPGSGYGPGYPQQGHPPTPPGGFGPVSAPPGGYGSASSGPVSVPPYPAAPVSGPAGQVSGPPVSSGPMSSGPVSSGPVSSGPVSSGPVSGGPVSGPPGSADQMSALPSSGPPGPWPPAGPRPPSGPVPPPGHGQAGGSMQQPGQQMGQQPGQPGQPAGASAGSGRKRGVLIAAVLVAVLVLGLGAYGVSLLGGDDTPSNGSAAEQTDEPSAGTDDGGSDQGGGNADARPDADIYHPDTDWTSTAEAYDGKAGTKIAFECPSGGTPSPVWGSEPFTSDSSVCTAAVHEGWFGLEDGGWAVIVMAEGQESYEGDNQYNIETQAYGPYAWSFTITG